MSVCTSGQTIEVGHTMRLTNGQTNDLSLTGEINEQRLFLDSPSAHSVLRLQPDCLRPSQALVLLR